MEYNVFCYKSALLRPGRNLLTTRSLEFMDSVEKRYRWITWIDAQWDIGPLMSSRPLGPILRLEYPLRPRKINISTYSYYAETIPLWSTQNRGLRVVFVTYEQAKELDRYFGFNYFTTYKGICFYYNQTKNLEENIYDIQQLLATKN